MDRKAKYIIAGLVLLIIFMLIVFVFLVLGGIAAYLIFMAPAIENNSPENLVTGQVVVSDLVQNELEDGWNTVENEETQEQEETEEEQQEEVEEQEELEPELTEIENVRIDSFTPLCSLPAPDGFNENGTPIKAITIKNTGHDTISVDGKITVSVTLDDVTDSTIEYNEKFSIAKDKTYIINLINVKNAGWNRAYLYVEGKSGLATVRIDLPDNKYIEMTKTVSGLC
ncbi:MAG: hypothetical protein JW703_02890 [Candidatus Diapherotrites archaeon]|nr:hypothetical protein [Candidatus Diapherotrites archaeon]